MRKQVTAAFLAIALAASLSSATVFADGHGSKADKPAISASRTITMSAEVESINHETREVTLRGPEGDTMSMTASEAIRNLAQVEAGDRVLAEITEEVSIEVVANPEGVAPGYGALSAEGRAEEGALPGAAVMDTMVISAVVEEINLESNSFKLRGPEGNIREFAARNPENLRKAEVGDLVVITITQAMGVIVEHPGEG